MYLISIIRYIFLAATSIVLLVQSVPAFRSRFLAYGKTAEPSAEGYKDRRRKSPAEQGAILKLLDSLATIQVPHSWFTHFYIACVACNIFWAYQITTHGNVYRYLSSYAEDASWEEVKAGREVVGGQTVHQVVVTWLCFLIQGSRRLYECLYLQKQGTSRMWFGHYALGIAYYTVMSVAIWVEATVAIDKFTFTPLSVYNLVGPPSGKSFLGILLFLLGSGVQHDCHVYLASLKKYTLPVHAAFEYLVCPHYFAECVIYLALAIISAPRGKGAVLNSTMVTGLVFVSVNLGCSSLLSRKWYEDKFGRHSVERKFLPILLT